LETRTIKLDSANLIYQGFRDGLPDGTSNGGAPVAGQSEQLRVCSSDGKSGGGAPVAGQAVSASRALDKPIEWQEILHLKTFKNLLSSNSSCLMFVEYKVTFRNSVMYMQ
jgi:hypothetical protein